MNGIRSRDIPRDDRLNPRDIDSIRSSKRYFCVRGFAWFYHHESRTGCSRRWASANSWCVIDLKQQMIIHVYGQYCKSCGGKSTPYFEDEVVRRMAQYACQTHLYRTSQRRKKASMPDMSDFSRGREGPHNQSCCEMCQILGHSCQVTGVRGAEEMSCLLVCLPLY